MLSRGEFTKKELKRELSKKAKKQFLVPICNLLRIYKQGLSRLEYANELAERLAEEIEKSRAMNKSLQSFLKEFRVKQYHQPVSTKLLANIHELQNILNRVYNMRSLPSSHPVQPKGPRTIRTCLCTTSILPLPQANSINCISCLLRFHRDCFQVRPTQRWECPYCSLQKMDPLNHVTQVCTIFLLRQHVNHKVQFTASIEPQKQFEIRSIKIDGNSNNLQCWPDAGRLTINGQKPLIFKPLDKNVSLKRRKDKSHVTLLKPGQNTIEFTSQQSGYQKDRVRLSTDPVLMGVFKIKKLTASELITKIEAQSTSSRSEELLREALNQDELTVESYKVPLICSNSLKRITIPARGKRCTHFKCFDLAAMILLNNTSRIWTCPVCNKHIVEFQIDYLLSKILKEQPRAVAVKFLKVDKYQHIMATQQTEQEQEVRPKSRKELAALKLQQKNQLKKIISLDDDEEGQPSQQPHNTNEQRKSLFDRQPSSPHYSMQKQKSVRIDFEIEQQNRIPGQGRIFKALGQRVADSPREPEIIILSDDSMSDGSCFQTANPNEFDLLQQLLRQNRHFQTSEWVSSQSQENQNRRLIELFLQKFNFKL